MRTATTGANTPLKHVMRTIAISIIALSFAHAADFDGTWKGAIKVADNSVDLVYVLKADGNKLTGTAEGPAGKIDLADNEIALAVFGGHNENLKVIERRIAEEKHRPLARDPIHLRTLYEARRQAYERADFRIETQDRESGYVVSRILALPLFHP